jgi:GTP-binding protein
MKTIALIGKPNVGKSSLFNRLVGQRIAITSDISGTTRDIKKVEFEIDDKKALLVDTGGLDESNEMFEAVKAKSIKSAQNADIVLFMVDGKMLPNDKDKKIFYEILKLGKDTALIVNKIDNDKMNEIVWEYQSFGAKDIFPISVSHNRGITPLLSWLYKRLPNEKELKITQDTDMALEDFLQESEKGIEDKLENDSNEIKVAIVGRVNVGKSSLLNSLLGEERAVVSSIAGTTIDPVDEVLPYKDKFITFVDTAGIRKRGKIEGIERYALNRTQKMLENADIALIVLDASEEFKELDERIASLVDKFSLGSIIILNKWDKARDEYKKVVEDVKYRFKFLGYTPIITVSALSKKRVHKINDMILRVYENYF